MNRYDWLSGEAARAYSRAKAEELRKLRECSASVLPDPDSTLEPASDGFVATHKAPDPSWPPSNPSVFGTTRSTPRYIKGVQHWFCPGCFTWVPREAMGVRRSRWNGLDYYCKVCKARMQKNTKR